MSVSRGKMPSDYAHLVGGTCPKQLAWPSGDRHWCDGGRVGDPGRGKGSLWRWCLDHSGK